MISSKFWSGKRVFITGHSGFKGTWLSLWLSILGAKVTGYSKDVADEQKVFFASVEPVLHASHFGDVRDWANLSSCVEEARPDIIFHLAAQSIVRESYLSPSETFETNLLGTVNVLECVRINKLVKATVVVTSDKCYANDNTGEVFIESDPLGGDDPYSASKACADIATNSYIQSFFNPPEAGSMQTAVASARAGNIIGGGDWGKSRLVPDLARAIPGGNTVEIRSPNNTRPWQFVLDALAGYILLAQNLCLNGQNYSGPWNFGPPRGDLRCVADVVKKFVQGTDIEFEFTLSETHKLSEKSKLMIDASKSERMLQWRPLCSFDDTLNYTRDWYLKFYCGISPKQLCEEQINHYLKSLPISGKFVE